VINPMLISFSLSDSATANREKTLAVSTAANSLKHDLRLILGKRRQPDGYDGDCVIFVTLGTWFCVERGMA
jgi:hypothetical protein